MDLWPHNLLCDLAKIDAPETDEGMSFRDVLFGDRQVVRDVLYGVYCGGTLPRIRCVKRGDWKLIKYDVLDGEVRKPNFFNLANNPNEFIAEHHESEVKGITGISQCPISVTWPMIRNMRQCEQRWRPCCSSNSVFLMIHIDCGIRNRRIRWFNCWITFPDFCLWIIEGTVHALSFQLKYICSLSFLFFCPRSAWVYSRVASR